MTRLTQLAICMFVAAGVGCGDLLASGTAQSAETSSEGQLLVALRAGHGERPPDGVFSAKEVVLLRTQLAADSPPFADGDLAFVVVDVHGRQVSSDAFACRRLRVERERGQITEVYPGVDIRGAPCQHDAGVHDDGADAAAGPVRRRDAAPRRRDAVRGDGRARRARRGRRVPRGRVPGPFLVRAAAKAYCGDGQRDNGEACDDGDQEDGDGCSCRCELEDQPDCCEDLACCGNGRIDPGEQCDDGNSVSGDGCSETCRIDLTP